MTELTKDRREDALAAFDQLCKDYDVADDDEYYFIRRHLTTQTPCPHVRTSAEGTSYCTLAEAGSAVPYVPEQIRRLPEKWDKDRKRGKGISALYCIKELERALASAPAASDCTDEQIIAACKAHDREDSAQRGEPSPWDEIDPESALFAKQWIAERMASMRAALAAIAAAPTKGGASND